MLTYAREGVERAVRRLRDAVHALHPIVLQHGGLEAAVQAAADQAARQGGFAAEVEVDPDAAGLRDELVLSLARELLTNAAKHADADSVRVAVRRVNGSVELEVADDGRGLDAAAVAAAPLQGHIGLASLIQRVEAVGGAVDLRANEAAGGDRGHGTTVRARLPIG
jgi:two-component system NarL family sensor kinase